MLERTIGTGAWNRGNPGLALKIVLGAGALAVVGALTLGIVQSRAGDSQSGSPAGAGEAPTIGDIDLPASLPAFQGTYRQEWNSTTGPGYQVVQLDYDSATSWSTLVTDASDSLSIGSTHVFDGKNTTVTDGGTGITTSDSAEGSVEVPLDPAFYHPQFRLPSEGEAPLLEEAITSAGWTVESIADGSLTLVRDEGVAIVTVSYDIATGVMQSWEATSDGKTLFSFELLDFTLK